jgi:hypothetical protein
MRVRQQFAIATAARVSLWLGSDHLLHVELSGFTETYKRFYFRDIQAITVQETTRRAVWNIVLLVPIVICLIGILMNVPPNAHWTAVIVWSIFASIFLLPFAVNNLRGTACTCQLRTAVQTEDLASLSRVRQTRKVLEKIRPLIEAAQGRLTAEEASARMQEAASGVAVSWKPDPPPPTAPPILT